jgi:hypothetical protein
LGAGVARANDQGTLRGRWELLGQPSISEEHMQLDEFDLEVLESPSLWGALTESNEQLATGELVDFIRRLNESSAFRRGELTNLLRLLQDILKHLADYTEGDEKVELGVGHVVLMAHTLLRRID